MHLTAPPSDLSHTYARGPPGITSPLSPSEELPLGVRGGREAQGREEGAGGKVVGGGVSSGSKTVQKEELEIDTVAEPSLDGDIRKQHRQRAAMGFPQRNTSV